MLYLLAWRNSWRNPHRTLGTVLSIALSMAGVWIFGSIATGLNAQRLQERLNTSLGHGKITHQHFLSHKPVEAYFLENEAVPKLHALGCAVAYAPRLNIRASLQNGTEWQNIDVYGVQPAKEKQVLQLYRFVRQGAYLPDEDAKEVVIGKDLAKRLQKNVGENLIIYLPQPLELRIIGIYEVPNKEFEETHVFLPYRVLRQALRLPDGACHQILLKIQASQQASLYCKRLQTALPTLRVRSWVETAPDLALLDAVLGYFLQGLVGFVMVLLGVLQYILLQIAWEERRIEWKRLHAWGLTKKELVGAWALEICLVFFMSIALGTIIGASILYGLSQKGIDLAIFSAGLSKLGYNTLFYPVMVWKELYNIIFLFWLIPIFSVLYIGFYTNLQE